MNYPIKTIKLLSIALTAIVLMFTSCQNNDLEIQENDEILVSEDIASAVQSHESVSSVVLQLSSFGSGVTPLPNEQFHIDGSLLGENDLPGNDLIYDLEEFDASIIEQLICGATEVEHSDQQLSYTRDFTSCPEFQEIQGTFSEKVVFEGGQLHIENTFENFATASFNVDGTIDKTLEETEDGVKISVKVDLTITFDDDMAFNVEAEWEMRISEQVQIQNGWMNVEDSEGDSWSSVINDPLMFFSLNGLNLPPSTGIEYLTYNGQEIELDYGDGVQDSWIDVLGEDFSFPLDIQYESVPGFNNYGISCYCNIGNECLEGSGNIVQEERDVSDFDKINAGGAFDIFVSIGSDFEVIVEADDNVLEFIITEVTENWLKIYFDSDTCLNLDETPKIFVTIPALKALNVSGASNVEGQSQFTGEELELEVSGAGGIQLDINYQNLFADISGAGNISLTGSVQEQTVSISGSAIFKAFDLTSAFCSIDASGASTGEIKVSEELTAQVSGVSRLFYKGNPVIDADVSFLGQLIDAN